MPGYVLPATDGSAAAAEAPTWAARDAARRQRALRIVYAACAWAGDVPPHTAHGAPLRR
jgi:hypothetical protein